MLRRLFRKYIFLFLALLLLDFNSLRAADCNLVFKVDPGFPPACEEIAELDSDKLLDDLPIDESYEANVFLYSELSSIKSGELVWLLAHFDIAPGWHLYWKNPGEAGLAPSFQWKLPSGFEVGEILWPCPSWIDTDSGISFGYKNELDLLIPIHVPKRIDQDTKIQLSADISWLACKDSCIPGSKHINLELQPSTDLTQKENEHEYLFVKARRLIPQPDKTAQIQLKNDELVLRFALEESSQSNIKGISFFPLSQGVFEYSSLKKWAVENRQYLIMHLKPTHKVLTLTSLEGVLLVEYQDGSSKSWDIYQNFTEYRGPVDSDRRDSKEMLNETQSIQISPQDNDKATSIFEKESIIQSFWKFVESFRTAIKADLGSILVLAFFGGMLLNIMPCVLPVIGLKILSFMQLSGQSRFKCFKHGVAYACGILFSFWCLVLFLFVIKASGKLVGWGFQLQEPLFVVVLSLILFAFAFSLFGVYDVGISLSSYAANLDTPKASRDASEYSYTLTSSFFSGILATVVATPCTGPLLGSALGFAASIEPSQAFIVFSIVGLGLAFPYLFLSTFPGLIRLLPKPGRWMVTFKQFMGFFMLATVLWLLWVLQAETENLNWLALIFSFLLVSFGLWIYGVWGAPWRSGVIRFIAAIFAVSLIMKASILAFMEVKDAKQRSLVSNTLGQTHPAKQSIDLFSDWIEFSPEKLQQLLNQGHLVFVDFTAKWCLICQANHFILESSSVVQAFKASQVIRMKADWTRGDPAITKALHQLGRNGVPVYALYQAIGKEPIILPETLTPDIVIKALKSVSKSADLE